MTPAGGVRVGLAAGFVVGLIWTIAAYRYAV
jgi:hypothetical protein